MVALASTNGEAAAAALCRRWSLPEPGAAYGGQGAADTPGENRLKEPRQDERPSGRAGIGERLERRRRRREGDP